MNLKEQIRDLAKMGLLEIMGQLIDDLKTQEVGVVKYTTNLGKVAYDLGRSDGRLEAYASIMSILNSHSKV